VGGRGHNGSARRLSGDLGRAVDEHRTARITQEVEHLHLDVDVGLARAEADDGAAKAVALIDLEELAADEPAVRRRGRIGRDPTGAEAGPAQVVDDRLAEQFRQPARPADRVLGDRLTLEHAAQGSLAAADETLLVFASVARVVEEVAYVYRPLRGDR